MVTGNPTATPAQKTFQQQRQNTTHAPPQAASPPTKQSLTTWWRTFKKNARREEEKVENPPGIFGVPLQVSVRYANVAISLTDNDGKSFIYGYVPIIVAKCGVYLKEHATDVEGIFRLNGSAKRIKDLQAVFDSPDRYGKGLDWDGYTVHDAANILRRYLNQLPEPIIPLDFYDRFRDPLRRHQAQAVGDVEGQGPELYDFDLDTAVKSYQQLITELPPLNRQLLLYILDLLAVFASKSDVNRMTAANLAAIFQPGLISHPDHDMAPAEYRLSQDVVIFLIENQDHFLIGMKGTAADEQTVQEVSNATPPRQQTPTPTATAPATPLQSLPIGRSASNASAGADSIRRFGGLRRHVSVTSKHSIRSAHSPGPGTPSFPGAYPSNGTSSGVHRSNTVPSNKSPALSSTRFNKPSDPPTPSSSLSPSLAVASSPGEAQPSPSTPSPQNYNRERLLSPSQLEPPAATQNLTLRPNERPAGSDQQIQEHGSQPAAGGPIATSTTPTKERSFPNIFSKSPSSDSERTRQPNKLRKKRIPGSANQSAQSSTNSLHAASTDAPASPNTRPLPSAHPVGSYSQLETIASSPPNHSMAARPEPESARNPSQTHDAALENHPPAHDSPNNHVSTNMLKPTMSPTTSLQSHSSVTDQSDFDQLDDPTAKTEKKEKRHRWRLSLSQKSDQKHVGSASNVSGVGSNAGAGHSSSSIGSSGRQRKSFTSEPLPQSSEPSLALASVAQQSSNESGSAAAGQRDTEKKGPIEWFRGKLLDKKDREAGKDRGKSPPRNPTDPAGSRQSLAAVAENVPAPERSAEAIDSVLEQPSVEAPAAAGSQLSKPRVPSS